jgi:bifunctional ADP-heptose synthase (sugar kinase/adenylyltransferase)
LDLSILAKILIDKNRIKNLIVTSGAAGVMLFRKNLKTITCPAFASQAIDKVGAGDAMLSIAALAIKQDLEPEITLFLGSIAAAISVKSIGNKVSVDINELDRIIQFMLK